MTAEVFWCNVKSLLKEHGVSQIQLAEDINVPAKTLQNWIFKSIVPDGIESYKIAKRLNTTVEFLVTGEKDILSNEATINTLKKMVSIVEYIDSHNTTLSEVFKN